MQSLKRAGIWLLLIVAVLGTGPTIIGYVWAIAWLPGYAAVCHLDKVFGPSITADGYRIFLLNRGCDLDVTIREVANGLKVDPDTLIAMYHGVYPKEQVSANDIMALDVLRDTLRKFSFPEPESDCPRGEYCAIKYWWSDDIITDIFSRIANVYSLYAERGFFSAVNNGADKIALILREGPIFQAFVIVFYIALAWMIKWIAGVGVDEIRNYFKTGR